MNAWTNKIAAALAVTALSCVGAALGAPRPSLEDTVRPLVEETLRAHHLPGAQVALVRDGRVVLARGYGLADVAGRVAVDAHTAFRVGSVSKLFAWTALMQLVERGDVRLDAPVNNFLRRPQVPAFRGRPLTVADLMTHTAGFEERELGGRVVAAKAGDVLAFPRALERALPRRVRPAGETAAYCNYCAALAGGIVEERTGQTFEACVEARVLAPLGMRRSTFRRAPPATRAKGYRWEDGTYREVPDRPLQLPAEGGLTSTADDMARFMVFALTARPAGVLSARSLRDMQRTRWRYDARLPGVALGWFEGRRGEERTVWHAGNVDGFGSWLTLVPGRQAGVYVVFNGASDERARMALTARLLDVLLGARPASPGARTMTAVPRSFSGRFRTTRRAYTTVQALETLLSGEVRARPQPDGTLVLTGPGRGFVREDGRPRRWTLRGDHLLQARDADVQLAYRTGAGGQVTSFQIGAFPFVVYERIPAAETSTARLALALCGLALTLVGGFVGGPDRGARRAVAALHLLTLLGTCGWVLTDGLVFGVSWPFVLAGAASLLAVAGTLGLIARALLAGRRERAAWATLLGCAMLSVFWATSHVLGFQL